MKFDNYRVEDFLQNESFFNWVKRNNQEDIEFWEAWWRDNPDHRHKASEAIDLLKTISFEEKGFNLLEVSDLWKRIKEETIEFRQINSNKKSWSTGLLNSHIMKVAAVTVPFVIGSILYLYHNKAAKDQTISSQLIVKEIPRGQKLTIYLPDGSMVKLNSESKISYQKPFDEDQRLVTLEGEAFFEVTPDPKRPFRVISGGIETFVVGTSFNISAYSDDIQVKVSVVSGKVSINKTSKEEKIANSFSESIVLSPSEQATFFVDKKRALVSHYDPNEVLGWREGILYFHNASMEEFVLELERWYGIDIVVKREIPIKKGIVGEFHNQSLEEILMGMHASSEFEYEFENGKLIIK